MSITVLCACGRQMRAKDEDAGKRAKCPHCGAVITIEVEVSLEDDVPARTAFQAVTLDVGKYSTSDGFANFSIRVTPEGIASIYLFVLEKDSRRKGEMLRFTPTGFAEFGGVVQKVSQTILQLQRSGQMRKMIE